MDYICGKRLAAILPEVIPILEKHREITRLQEKLFKTAASRWRARISTTIHKQANHENRAI